MVTFQTILDPVFNWMLIFPPYVVIFLIALLVSFIAVIIYKYTTDQKLMKSLKEEIKKYQEQAKKERKNPDKMMKIQKKAMEANMKYMMHSFKPTLITFIPIIIIFGWLSGHLAFVHIDQGQEFVITANLDTGKTGNITIQETKGLVLQTSKTVEIYNGTANWTLKASELGTYNVDLDYNNKTYSREVIISDKQIISPKDEKIDRDGVKTISLEYRALKPIDFSIFGWKPGWLAHYIVLSIVFSMLLRKVLNVY